MTFPRSNQGTGNSERPIPSVYCPEIIRDEEKDRGVHVPSQRSEDIIQRLRNDSTMESDRFLECPLVKHFRQLHDETGCLKMITGRWMEDLKDWLSIRDDRSNPFDFSQVTILCKEYDEVAENPKCKESLEAFRLGYHMSMLMAKKEIRRIDVNVIYDHCYFIRLGCNWFVYIWCVVDAWGIRTEMCIPACIFLLHHHLYEMPVDKKYDSDFEDLLYDHREALV